MLLAERFLPGAGWVEAAVLALYAGWLAHGMRDPRRSAMLRRRAWLLFSVVFFTQLGLGLAGFESFLMTGKLHVPVPAMIVGGPAFRGEGFFMLILFGVTLVLAGPAWCSHLCYIGAWDSLAAGHRGRPGAMPSWQALAQPGMLVLVIAGAVAMRLAGVSPGAAAMVGIAFGVAGLAVMVLYSRRMKVMVHCTLWCPIGWLATRLGKVSPFRMKITTSCTDCGACATLCRYGALKPQDIRARRPGPSCTLCGDCVRACRGGFVEYRLPGLRADRAREVFLVVVTSLHAVFLGVARI